MREKPESSKQTYSQAMSQLKRDLAEEMGLWDLIEDKGWGFLTAKECGRIGGKMASNLSPNLIRNIAAQGEPKSHERPPTTSKATKGGETCVSTALTDLQSNQQRDMDGDDRIHL